jgi:2-oxo-3-hexenedioate decarboxylase
MNDLEAIAREMMAAQEEARQIVPFTERWPQFGLQTAYEVAGLIHRARVAAGARPVGRKIGFTNADMWRIYGVREPVWAHVYEHTVTRLQGTSCRCGIDRMTEPKIEPEIVFGFRTVPAEGAGLEEILDAVEWIAHGFEVVQSHFPHWKFAAADTVADWALHACLFIGPVRPVDQLGALFADALAHFEVDLACDGELQETGGGGRVLGSPLQALACLQQVLAKQPQWRLRPGEIVSTGTLTTARPMHAGQTWTTSLRGIDLPGLTLKVDAPWVAPTRVDPARDDPSRVDPPH